MSPALFFGSARSAVAVSVVYSTILVVGAVIPTTPQSSSLLLSDKVVHAVAYGLHAGLLFWAAFGLSGRAVRSGVLAVTGACCVGALTEILQIFVPHRTFQLSDFAADAAGSATFAGLCVLATEVSMRRDPESGVVERRGS